jgi:3'(2'), 5'-bisphosphate nucleotidase
VKASLLSDDRDSRRVVEKNDQTHVTIADFGVQALISYGNSHSSLFLRSASQYDMHFAVCTVPDATLITMALLEELQKVFPSIPLVAEEDSTFLRSPDADSGIVDLIESFVASNVSNSGSPLTHDDVLGAIDRGGREAVSFDSNPATYWVSYGSLVYHTSRSAKIGSRLDDVWFF